MSSTAINSLINVRYYSPQDPYHYSTDNRPLTDLNTNIVSLAGLIDGLSSGNVFYVVDTSGVVNSLETTTSLLAPTGPYTAGQLITIRVNNTNTGAVTFTANSGAAYSVNGMSGALQGGELVSGKHYLLSWEDSDAVWELVGSSKGNLQVAAAVRSSQAVNLGQLTDGGLSPTFNVVNAAAGTSGNELVNYTQMTDGSLTPRFSLIERNSSQESQNWLPNSTFLFGVAGWQAPPAGMYTGTTDANTYARYGGTDPSLQHWNSNPVSAGWIQPGATCTLSGWLFNGTASGDSSIAISCFESNGTFIGNITVAALAAGTAWTYGSATGVFPTGTAYVEVSLGFQGASSGSNISFSRLKFEAGATATLWDDAASAQLFQNGQFSPTFDNIQINGSASLQSLTATTATLSGAVVTEGSVQLNSNWTNGTSGIVIGANPAAAAGILLNAPAGYTKWLEQLMVDNTIMWHVDSSGDAAAAGEITASSANITGDQTIGGTLTVSGDAVAAGGITASAANITGDQTIGGNLAVTGDATFSSGFALNSVSYLEVNSPSSENGANISLTGNGTATPTKFLRAYDGEFQVINSAYTQALLNLTDSGNFSVGGTAVAAAGTSGGELINYTQMTDGSLNPTFGPVTLSPATNSSQAVALSQLGNLNGFTYIGSSQTLSGTAYGTAIQVGNGVVVTLPTSDMFGGLLYFYGGPYSIVSNSNQFIYSPQIGMADTTGPITLNCPNGEDVLLFCRGSGGEFDVIGGSILVTQAVNQTFGHPLSVPAGTTGNEAVNYTQMTDGSLSPTLDSIQVNGPTSLSGAVVAESSVQLNSNWANGTNGIVIGPDNGGTAGILLNAPSGFVGWLEQLMVDDAVMWHVDPAGDAVAAGEISAFAANITNNQTIGGTLAVSGDATFSSGFALNGVSYLEVNSPSSGNGANIALTGNGTATPAKYLRTQNGVFQILNSAYSQALLNLTDSGDLTIPGSMTAPGGVSINGGNSLIIGTPPSGDAAAIMVNVPASDTDWLLQLMNNGISMLVVNGNGNVHSASTISAAAGTSGGELVNYTQMTNGSLSPTFGNITTTTQTTTSNQDIGGTLTVTGTASAAAGTSGNELVNISQFTTKPFYYQTWGGYYQTTGVSGTQSATFLGQDVTFPAYSKTGGFIVQVTMTLAGVSSAVGNQNYYSSIVDNQGFSMAGVPWLQNFVGTGASWGISDTFFLNKVYTPGEYVTFTAYLNAYGGSGTSNLNGGTLQLIVFEA